VFLLTLYKSKTLRMLVRRDVFRVQFIQSLLQQRHESQLSTVSSAEVIP
jgi:hypothetical protein